jgi:hypothetical protein
MNSEKFALSHLNDNKGYPQVGFLSQQQIACDWARHVRERSKGEQGHHSLVVFDDNMSATDMSSWSDEALAEILFITRGAVKTSHKINDILKYRKFITMLSDSQIKTLNNLDKAYEAPALSVIMRLFDKCFFNEQVFYLNRFISSHVNLKTAHVECLDALLKTSGADQIERLTGEVNSRSLESPFYRFFDDNGHLDKHLDGDYSERADIIAHDYACNLNNESPLSPDEFLDRLRARVGAGDKPAIVGVLHSIPNDHYILPLKMAIIGRLGAHFGILAWLKKPNGDLYCAIGGYHFTISYDMSLPKPLVYLTVKEKGGRERKLRFLHQHEAQDFAENFIDLVRQFQFDLDS